MRTFSEVYEKARKESEQACIIGMVFVVLVVAAVRAVNGVFGG